MSKRIIRPSGMELIKALNSGDYICNNCGAIMDRKEDPNGCCDILVCPGCNEEIDEMDYEWKGDDDEDDDEDDDYDSIFEVTKNTPPTGCSNCGGPWPQCMTSCRLYDD